MKLIIVEGGEASGKTTLGYKLSSTLNIPLFVKDEYKSDLKQKDKRFQKVSSWIKLEKLTNNAIYSAIDSAIIDNKSLIIEGNYILPHKRKFQIATQRCPCIIDIECHSTGIISLKRFIKRNEKIGRPDGYKDLLRYCIVVVKSMFARVGLNLYKPMKLSDNFLRLETTDFSKIDYKKVIDFVKNAN